MFKITEEAQLYVANLFTSQSDEGLGLKIDISKGGTPGATISFNFCFVNDLDKFYVKFPYEGFDAYIYKSHFEYLEDSEVSLKDDGSGKKISFHAPHSRGVKPGGDSSLSDRIKYTIESDVNPSLASHRGFVDLVEITGDMDVVLNFGGGCQGCSSVKVTLKNGVEAQLKAIHPEIRNILDATDHSKKENSYM